MRAYVSVVPVILGRGWSIKYELLSRFCTNQSLVPNLRKMIPNPPYFPRCSSQFVAHLINLVLVITFLAVPAFGASEPIQKTQNNVEREQTIFKERFQIHADELKKSMQKEAVVQLLQQRLNDQDKRIGDINLFIELLSILITIIGVGVGFAAYVTARQKARESAEQWFKDNERNLRARIAKIEEYVNQVKEKSDNSIREIEQASTEAKDAINRFQKGFLSEQQPKPTVAELNALRANEQTLKRKPEIEYTSEDWSNRAFAAYAEGKLDLAAEYFGVAANMSEADAVKQAQFVVNRGIMLDALGRYDDAIAAYDKLLVRFGDATEPVLHEWVDKALYNKGCALNKLRREEDAIAVYDKLLVRFEDATEPALHEWVIKALNNKGVALKTLGRDEDAIATYDKLLELFGKVTTIHALPEWVATVLNNKGVALKELGRYEDAIAVNDRLLERFGEATEPVISVQLAIALNNKGVSLSALGRNEDAIAIFDKLLERFGDATGSVMCEYVVKALYNKGCVLNELGRNEDAIAAYDKLLERFGDATDPVLHELIIRATLMKGNMGKH